jgi:hypothetical protein
MGNNKLKKHSRTLVIVFVMLISLLTLSACAKDTTAPVINSVGIVSKTVTVEATDNKKVTGYKSTYSNVMPAVDSDNWQVSNVLTLTDDGTYYVWVKDAAGNITGFSEAIVVNTLAERFDHLNWLTPATGTKTVDGVTYNLADLKAKYGDLYRYVEPLTNAEIESRFAYIAKFYEAEREYIMENGGVYNWYIEGNLIAHPDFDEYIPIFRNKTGEIIGKSNDPILGKFNKYFSYSETFKMYTVNMPESFKSESGLKGIGLDIINTTSILDKEFYIRYFMDEYENFARLYEKFDLELQYGATDMKDFIK